MSTFFSHAFGNSTSINDNNFNELVQFGVTSSAVNFVKITNSATNSNVAITAAGGDSHIGLDIAAKGDRGVNFTSSTSNSSHIKLYETSTNGSGYVGLRAPTSVSANYILTFPSKDGTSGQVLQTNGTGTLSFTTALTNGISAFNVSNNGTIGSADTTDAMTLSSNGVVIFKENIKINDGGTIGCNAVGDAMTILSNGVVTFKDDIMIKNGGTIGSSNTGDAMTIASDGLVTFGNNIKIGNDGTIGSTGEASAMAIASSGLVTFGNNIKIPDAGTIGSATTADAIAIANDGAVTLAKGLTITPSVVTSVSTNSGAATAVNLLHSVVYFDVDSTSAMFASIGSGSDGKIIHIFYDNEKSGSLRINFGATVLRSGSGNAQYLTFNQTGQSASLIFINTTSKWCILNTGAAVS
tara:strand:+ start:154 stop:1383 length:1230 start_codon:yes stop_codon:yes gene_type:complete